MGLAMEWEPTENIFFYSSLSSRCRKYPDSYKRLGMEEPAGKPQVKLEAGTQQEPGSALLAVH